MAFDLENIRRKDIVSENKVDKTLQFDSFLKKEIPWFGNKFGSKKKQSFYNELAVLLKAGITIKDSLLLITESFKKNKDKIIFKGVYNDIIQGRPFSEALLSSKVFSEYEYYSVKIGEETGTVTQVCQELAKYFERKNEQRKVVLSALTYPSIVMTTALIVVIFMLTYVVPMFQDIFKQNGMDLPSITKAIIALSSFIKNHGFKAFIIIIFFVCLLRYFRGNKVMKRYVDYSLIKIPFLGNFIAKVYVAQFTQAVALLTSSKIPMLKSIQMVKLMINFIPLQDALHKIEKSILQGESLSVSMSKSSLFDNRIITLIKVAEQTNQTEYVLKQLNEQYGSELESQSKAFSSILEPIIILGVGGIVAILLIAMYLPMFQLSTAIS